MSWPYPPRSRSRSPRSRQPYIDPAQDTYRADWDGYDRDRAWPGYDRGYDYGRRGRSRSPPLDEGARTSPPCFIQYSSHLDMLQEAESADAPPLPMTETGMILAPATMTTTVRRASSNLVHTA